MNVIDQARNVVQGTESLEGRVTLTLDLDQPEHRAALSAALAVLRALGDEGESLLAPAAGGAGGAGPAGAAPLSAPPAEGDTGSAAGAGGVGDEEEESGEDGEDGALRRSYAEAVSELTPDAARQARIVRDTFPHIRELLRDGANVAAVAQIQHQRWAEEHPDAARSPGSS
ncbi:MAG TPA: hypothetical protein VH257_19375 [Chloroflexota bacterium]|nr:hypothetical protein [Chloroflexota bacterium]